MAKSKVALSVVAAGLTLLLATPAFAQDAKEGAAAGGGEKADGYGYEFEDDPLAAGGFMQAAGVPARKIALRDSTGWRALDQGVSSDASCLAVLPTGDLVVGGTFERAGAEVSVHFATWSVGSPICAADFDCSGAASVQDIFDFLAAYFGNNPRADFNHSGAISVQDIFDFLSAYFAGC